MEKAQENQKRVGSKPSQDQETTSPTDIQLNKTGEVAKKIIGGAASVLGNISGEMKKP